MSLKTENETNSVTLVNSRNPEKLMPPSIGVSQGSRISVGEHLVKVISAHGNHIFISIDGGEPTKVTEEYCEGYQFLHQLQNLMR
jgi:hypothetical protein